MSSDAQTRNYVIMPWSKEAGRGGGDFIPTLSHFLKCNFFKNLKLVFGKIWRKLSQKNDLQ